MTGHRHHDRQTCCLRCLRLERDARRADRSQHGRHADRRSDAGMTLVEVLVAMFTLLLLLTAAVVTLSAFLSAGTQITARFAQVDQVLPTTATIQRLVRSEVQPAPGQNPANTQYPTPIPGFGVAVPLAGTTAPYNANDMVNPLNNQLTLTGIGNFSLSFYANVGNANGPALIVAQLANSNFTVTQTIPTANTCPTVTGSTNLCQYSASHTQTIVTIPNVVNGTDPTVAATYKPVFTYTTLFNNTTTTIAPASVASTFATCVGGSTQSTSTIPNTCPANTIESVGIDLVLQNKGTNSGEYNTVVYRLSANSYLFSGTVG